MGDTEGGDGTLRRIVGEFQFQIERDLPLLTIIINVHVDEEIVGEWVIIVREFVFDGLAHQSHEGVESRLDLIKDHQEREGVGILFQRLLSLAGDLQRLLAAVEFHEGGVGGGEEGLSGVFHEKLLC